MVAPLPGVAVYAAYTNDHVGQNIIVTAPFEFDGDRVYYQIVHFTELRVGAGDSLARGQKIGALVNAGIVHGDPAGKRMLDFGVYHTDGDWTSVDAGTAADITQYIDVGTLIRDDLASLSNLVELPRCEGNPK